MPFRSQAVDVIRSSVTELSALLDVADEQQFLQKYMSPEVVQQCIQENETNSARMQVLCEKLIQQVMVGDMKLYDALGDYLLKRSEDCYSVHQRFKIFESVNNNSNCSNSFDGDSELIVLQEKVKEFSKDFLHWSKLHVSPDCKAELFAIKHAIDKLERTIVRYSRYRANEVIPRRPLTPSQKGKFTWYNQPPLESDYEGKFTNIYWGELNEIHKRNWKDVVNGDQDLRFDFPPLHVLDLRPKVVAILYAYRRENDFVFFGGLHPKVPSEVSPVTVRLQLRLEFTRGGGEILVQEKNAFLTDVSCSMGFLLTVFDFPWNEMSTTIAPLVNWICIHPEFSSQGKFYNETGLPPRYSNDGEFGAVDWGNLEGKFYKAKREWKIMVVDNDERALLEFPPLIVAADIVHDVAVDMFAARKGNDLVFYGGLHKNVDKSVKEYNMDVTVEVQFYLQNGDTEQHKFEDKITLQRKGEVGFKTIFSLSELAWNTFSSELTPRVTRLVFKTPARI